jgi:hypothetical protein
VPLFIITPLYLLPLIVFIRIEIKGTIFMQNVFSWLFSALLKRISFFIAVTLILFLTKNTILFAAGTNLQSNTSLKTLIEVALDQNLKNKTNSKYLAPEDITFLVKKYYYQIETQFEQLTTAREVQAHFQKAIDKSIEIFNSGEGDVSQVNITKLKLGLSSTLNNIIDLEHNLKLGKLSLAMLINREPREVNDIVITDPIPMDFPYTSFDEYLSTKNLILKVKKLTDNVVTASKKNHDKQSTILSEESSLFLYQAYLNAESSRARVTLAKKNRKITRALLISEVANYDFGIGDSQELFEALIIYTRVFSSYLDSVYTLNVAVAELEKITDAVYIRYQ